MRILTILILLIAGFSVTAQTNLATNNSAHADSANNACMQNASKLLDEAFVLMQKNYYRRDDIDWSTLKESARLKLQSRGYCNDAYETINWCFAQMREKHSFIMPTLKAAEYNNDVRQLGITQPLHKLMGTIHGEWLGDSTAYISIPWVSTTDEQICGLIADSLQQLIELLDSRPVNKWIVDLRQNSGGNCWPMIAGAGPLIGEGICGYFIRNEERVAISYKNGMAMQGRQVRCKTSRSSYQLKTKNNTIVILTSNNTSSSGEIVALSFKGKEQVHFWGEATAGFTTANATYTLSDQSMLVLTVCHEADRNGKVYTGRLIPDFPMASDMRNGDAIKDAALSWLKNK